LLTAIFTGLRSSELRGLRWSDVDLKRSELHVRQRADRYNKIGPPKSAAGERTVPLPPVLVSALRKWKLACPNGELGLTFPDSDGTIEGYVNQTRRVLNPVLRAARLTVPVLNKDGTQKRNDKGELVLDPKYGWHSLRHFYASWSINPKSAGGLELPSKVVQARMGHASIAITMDVYGHLFPRGDDGAELAAAAQALLA
jgi:integrase